MDSFSIFYGSFGNLANNTLPRWHVPKLVDEFLLICLLLLAATLIEGGRGRTLDICDWRILETILRNVKLILICIKLHLLDKLLLNAFDKVWHIAMILLLSGSICGEDAELWLVCNISCSMKVYFEFLASTLIFVVDDVLFWIYLKIIFD